MASARVAPTLACAPSTSSHGLLRPATRRVLWTLLVSLQLANAVLLALLATLYFNRTRNGSLLWLAMLRFLFADAYAFLDRFYLVLAVAYALLSAVFAVNGLQLVYVSLRGRKLCFGTSAHVGSRVSRLQSEANMVRAVFSPLHFRDWITTSRRRRVLEWFELAFYISGVHGPLFDVRFVIERIVGVVTQTIAAYSSSQNISDAYLNQTYSIVLFLSCVSVPILHRFFLRSGRTQQRLSYVVADVVLDFVWGSLVPLWMHLRIVFAHYETLADTAAAAREMGHVLILSWPNFVLSVVPFISSIFGTRKIRVVLHQWSTRQRCDLLVLGAKGPPARLMAETASKRFTQFVRKWPLFTIHASIAVYGCVVLAVSLSANDVLGLVVKHPEYPCVSPLHPWFSTKEACVKRYVNCTALGIKGRSSDIEAALQLFDGRSLSDLHLQSCPALEIPTTLHQFSGLIRLVIEKSWIVEWSHSAAISREKTPTVRTIKLLRVDTNATLHGLVSVPISASIEYIRIFKVPNADTILRPVGSNWQHLHFFECDGCDLPDVPLAVDTMYQLEQLSLMDSRISTLRDDWITNSNLKLSVLWMDGSSQLTELSDVLWRQAATCSVFSMLDTNLSFIPEWLPTVARKDFLVLGHGSPVCDPAANVLRNASSKVRQLVNCQAQ